MLFVGATDGGCGTARFFNSDDVWTSRGSELVFTARAVAELGTAEAKEPEVEVDEEAVEAEVSTAAIILIQADTSRSARSLTSISRKRA